MTKLYPQIVLFGDSLIQGSAESPNGISFQGLLQCSVLRFFDVVNRGFSGYNTKNALEALPEIFQPAGPSVPKLEYVLVLLGANDACQVIPTNTQGIPLDQYVANLKAILTHPHITSHSPKILLVTPPPVDEIQLSVLDTAYGHATVTRTVARSASYSQAAREVGSIVPGVVTIDLHKALYGLAVAKTPGWDEKKGVLGDPASGERGYLEKLLWDGLHLSGEAYEVFYGLVKEHIKCPEEMVFPDWRKVNPNNGGI